MALFEVRNEKFVVPKKFQVFDYIIFYIMPMFIFWLLDVSAWGVYVMSMWLVPFALSYSHN